MGTARGVGQKYLTLIDEGQVDAAMDLFAPAFEARLGQGQ